MDAYEATKIVFERIQNLDPHNASKIMGFLLIQDHGEKEMIRLAFGSESSVQAVILRVKKELGLGSPNTPLGTPSSSPFSNPRELNHLSSTNSPWKSSSAGFPDFHSAEDFISSSNGEIDLLGELQLQNQLSFLNDGGSQIGGKPSDLFYHDLASSPSRNDAVFFGGGGFPAHRRSFSVTDDDLSLGFGWKPCLFYARGYCKNGTTCRFLHSGGELAGDEGGGALCKPDLISSANYSPILQQLSLDNSPRSLMVDKFAGIRELGMNGLSSPGSSRQIYLTFPTDSTFKEEDVSNYFSNFGPVQDVRIPYQQKRMFGFVTFEYPDTVRLILAKGNPHFVCDARVLVKPYKEKGKIPDKHRKQIERGEFGGSPTGMEARDPYDFQLGARTFYNTPDMLWRKKLEDQVDLQQAIELQNRRLMNLRLLDIKRNNHHRTLSTGSLNVSSPTYSPTFFSRNFFAHTTPETKQEYGDEDNSIEKENSNLVEKVAAESERLEHEHDLPDSPFASVGSRPLFSVTSSPSKVADVAPFKSCYFQAPRLASGHETVGM